jgi:hypothetical protein
MLLNALTESVRHWDGEWGRHPNEGLRKITGYAETRYIDVRYLGHPTCTVAVKVNVGDRRLEFKRGRTHCGARPEWMVELNWDFTTMDRFYLSTAYALYRTVLMEERPLDWGISVEDLWGWGLKKEHRHIMHNIRKTTLEDFLESLGMDTKIENDCFINTVANTLFIRADQITYTLQPLHDTTMPAEVEVVGAQEETQATAEETLQKAIDLENTISEHWQASVP